MKSKRSIIRAILFIVRMQRASAQTLCHCRSARGYFARGTPRASNYAPATVASGSRASAVGGDASAWLGPSHRSGEGGRPYVRNNSTQLKRCESTRGRNPTRFKYGGKHRNSAPTAFLPRTPTPQIEIRLLDEADECNFSSYSRMMQPYMLRLERSNSSGSSGGAPTHSGFSYIYGNCGASLMGSASNSSESLTSAAAAAAALRGTTGAQKSSPQITVHPTMAHHLASKLLLQKQPSLDDRIISNVDLLTTEFGKYVRRQGSVESTEKKKHAASRATAAHAGALDRKAKHSMVNLFGALTAVEQGDLDSLRIILSKNCFSLCATIEYAPYGHFDAPVSLLDVALMLGQSAAAELLLSHGATENPMLLCIEDRRRVVNTVLETSLERLRTMREKQNASKEDEKRISLLESQINTIRKMKTVVDQRDAPLPGAPSGVRAFVSSSSQATVEFVAPQAIGASIIVKYRVEWSRSSSFERIDDCFELTDMRRTRVIVGGLEHGAFYSFRVAAANIFGFGEFTTATPKSLQISSWEDVNDTPNYRLQQMQNMNVLFDQVERHRQSTVWQRGVYLASVIYTENKVLCTVDDCLPVLCADENTSTVTTDDLHWLMKLSLCWDQVPYLLESISATSVSNASQLRAKLLEAITSMMNALGVRDIGRVHHVPLLFSNGVTFIVSVNLVNENQTVQGLAMRWMRMEKLLRKRSFSCPAFEYLNRELFNIINFFESSQIPLDAGLYLCYLRLESSLNVIRVTVPENVPSVLPFALIRTNPHVSCEEWQWLKQLDLTGCSLGVTAASVNSSTAPSTNSPESSKGHSTASNVTTGSGTVLSPAPPRPTPLQYAFHQQLGRAASVLVHDLDMKPDQIQNHRLFRLQVLQLHSDVSFILIMPKAEDVCHVNPGYGANEETLSENFKGCISIPAPVFQMINLFTYQPDFITGYCRLSVFIEHFIMILQCEQRQCLLENDSKVYLEQLEKLNEFQKRLDTIWRASRWISNIASVARDRQANCALPLAQIISTPASVPLVDGGGFGVAHGPSQDDSAVDVGYHSDQSAGKFSPAAKTNLIENFTQCNATVRAKLRASKLYENCNNAMEKSKERAKNGKELRDLRKNDIELHMKLEEGMDNSDPFNEGLINEADSDEFIEIWKGRARGRRHSEKNVRHASLCSLGAQREHAPVVSVKSSDYPIVMTKNKKKTSIISMLQSSSGDSKDSRETGKESSMPSKECLEPDWSRVARNQTSVNEKPRNSTKLAPIDANGLVGPIGPINAIGPIGAIIPIRAKLDYKPTNAYQRQRRPISMYARTELIPDETDTLVPPGIHMGHLPGSSSSCPSSETPMRNASYSAFKFNADILAGPGPTGFTKLSILTRRPFLTGSTEVAEQKLMGRFADQAEPGSGTTTTLRESKTQTGTSETETIMGTGAMSSSSLEEANSVDCRSAGSANDNGTTLPGSLSTPVKTCIVRVYVAYECGLENGASVRLKITSETTAREIVALVVEQIAKVVASPSKIDSRRNTVGAKTSAPSNPNENFCLVSLVGNRERRIRDSFPMLKLQSPWNKGRLYVRHVNCISVAIHYGNEEYV